MKSVASAARAVRIGRLCLLLHCLCAPARPAPPRSTVLYNVALCKVNFWRATVPFGVPSIQPSTGQGSRTATLRQAPQAADYRPSSSSIPKALSRRSRQARSTAPACVRSGLSRFLQAKRACRASPPLLASRCSEVIRCSVIAANRPAGLPARRIFR